MTLRGFASRENTAPLNKRYEGLYHYSAYYGQWDLIVAAGTAFWTVRAVDLDGNFTGPERTHSTPLHADMFANRPFMVTARDLERCHG